LAEKPISVNTSSNGVHGGILGGSTAITMGTGGGPGGTVATQTPETPTLIPAFACAIAAFTTAPLRPRVPTMLLC
jgi:hypothetical protein